MNISKERLHGHLINSLSLNFPAFQPRPAHTKSCAIVCSGPSLKDTWNEIREDSIFACNNAHDFLIEKGIIPTYGVAVDGLKGTAEFYQNPHDDVEYLIASQCHPDVFRNLKGHTITLWHSWDDYTLELLELLAPATKENPHPWMMVGGGGSIGNRCFSLAYVSGYRDFHIYGMDSCYGGPGENHVLPQFVNHDDTTGIEPVTIGGKTFLTAEWMRVQADFFRDALKTMFRDCKVTVHGDCLLAAVAESLKEHS